MATSQVFPVTRIVPRVPRGVTARPASRAIRLTRRGRVVVRALAALVFVVAVAAVVLLINRPAVADTQARPMAVTYHVVLPGETLLEIAAGVDPRADARDTAVRIARLNALDGWGLQAGQRLALPVGG